MYLLLQEEHLHSSEREKQSLREQLTRTGAEARQQLRQKVDVLVIGDSTAQHVPFTSGRKTAVK